MVSVLCFFFKVNSRYLLQYCSGGSEKRAKSPTLKKKLIIVNKGIIEKDRKEMIFLPNFKSSKGLNGARCSFFFVFFYSSFFTITYTKSAKYNRIDLYLIRFLSRMASYRMISIPWNGITVFTCILYALIASIWTYEICNNPNKSKKRYNYSTRLGTRTKEFNWSVSRNNSTKNVNGITKVTNSLIFKAFVRNYLYKTKGHSITS